LRETLEKANDAANYVSEWAWQNRTLGQYTLHKALYYRVKDEFGLSAQIVVRVIAKVADAYKLDKGEQGAHRSKRMVLLPMMTAACAGISTSPR
jgi:RAB protein geranylgeranyltransferase component A